MVVLGKPPRVACSTIRGPGHARFLVVDILVFLLGLALSMTNVVRSQGDTSGIDILLDIEVQTSVGGL